MVLSKGKRRVESERVAMESAGQSLIPFGSRQPESLESWREIPYLGCRAKGRIDGGAAIPIQIRGRMKLSGPDTFAEIQQQRGLGTVPSLQQGRS